MSHPLLEHVERDAVYRRVDSEPVAQAFRGPMRRVRYPGLDHNGLDDLPDPHAAERPDWHGSPLARLLGFPDAMRGVQGVQIVRGHWNAPVDDPRGARGVLALLEAADCDRAAGEVYPGWGDLEQLGWPTAGEVQRLAERAIARRLAPGDRQEGGALFSVEVEPVSGIVGEAHLAHV